MVSSSVDTSGDGWFNAKYKGWQAETARLHPREMQYARDATRWSQEMAAQYAGDAAKVDWPEWQAEAEQQYREGCARRDAAGEEKRLQEEAEQEQLFLEWADKEQRADQAQADKKQRADKAQQWAEFVIWQKNDRENAHNDALEFERMTKSQMTISQWENLSRKQQKNHTRDHQRAGKLNKTVEEYKQGIKEALHKEQATPYRQNQHEEERQGIVHIDFKKGQMADPQSNRSKAKRKYWECQAARHPFSLNVVAWRRNASARRAGTHRQKDGKNRGGASASRCSDSPKDKSPFGTSMEDKDSARFKLLELTMQRINAQAMDVDGVKMREKLACKDAAWHERNESIEEAIHRLRSEEDIREDREWKWSQMPDTIMHDNSWTQYTHDEWLSHLRTKVDRAIEECRPEYYTMPDENKKDFWDLITDALVQEEHVKHIELLDESCRHLLDAGENGNSFKKQRTETDIRDAEHAEARRQQEVFRRAQEKDEAAEERARQRGCARKISLIMKMPSPRPKMIQVKIEGDTAEMLRDTTEIVLDTSGPEDEEEEAEAEEEEVEVEEKGSGKESKWIEDDDWGKRKRKQVVFSARCKYKARRKDSNDFSPVPPRPKWRGTTRTWIVGTDKSGACKFEDFQDDEGEQASSSQPEACELPEANKMEANKMEADKKKANKEANNLEANSDFSRVPVIHNSQFIIHSSQFIIRSTHAPGNLKPKPGKDGIDSDLHRWGGGAKQKNQKDGTPSMCPSCVKYFMR